MAFEQVLIAAGLAFGAGAVPNRAIRRWLLFLGSALALFWLQPVTPIRHLHLWLPVLAMALAAGAWAVTRPGAAARAGAAARGALVAAIITAFIVLKTPALAELAGAGLRTLAGQPADLASPLDLRWLGFSYLAFRLLHVLRDAAAGRLPAVGLLDFMTYAVFGPALVAGPIDRLERFAGELNAGAAARDRRPAALARLTLGLFKKFAVADSLALIALAPSNAGQVDGPWLWLLLYAYAFRIYFDFSGYTDIAIGLGLAGGVKLPENFARPYAQSNLTAFWNAWHITLADWFRAYFFNPLTRWMRRRRFPAAVVIFSGQLGAMLLIGLWHGLTWNFLAWGLWHGVGLFVHNRWSAARRAAGASGTASPTRMRWAVVVQQGLGRLATFHFVVLGWVWFVMDDPAAAWDVLVRLVGTLL